MTETLCSYFDGMFQHEDPTPQQRKALDFVGACSDAEAAAHHEAGHAVLSYALEEGLTEIRLVVTERKQYGFTYYGHAGSVHVSNRTRHRINEAMKRGRCCA